MRRHVFAPAIAIAALLGGAACESPSGPAATSYSLSVVNEIAVPAPHPEFQFLEIVSGSLTLRTDGRAEETTVVRCRADVPAGTECVVTQPASTRTGTYSRTEGWIRFGERQYPASFATDAVTIEYGPPPSSGVLLRASFRYVRS